MRWFSLIVLVSFPFAPGFSQNSVSPTSATSAEAKLSADVVKMAQSGVTDDVLLAYIKNARSAFNLSADDIVSLRNQGLSSPVIAAMLQHDISLRSAPRASVAASVPVAAPTPAQSAPASTTLPVPQTVPQQVPQPVETTPAQTPPPPPPQVEVVPVSPGPGYYWNGGYWSYYGNSWAWVGGSWGYATPNIYIGGYYGRPWGYGGHYHGHWGGHGYGGHRGGHRH